MSSLDVFHLDLNDDEHSESEGDESSDPTSDGEIEEECKCKEKVQIDFYSMNPEQKKLQPVDFELLKVLGRGGYGKVFLARKITGPDLNHVYAMKVLKKACIVANARDLEHTKAERNILQLIQHPFLVELHYAFQTQDRLYLVLEFLAGGELFTQLERNIQLSEDSARFYLAEIVLALGHLHSMGIIYRDLKPENILLDSAGHVKLTDFGLCKESIDAINGVTHTFCGTIEYMAPEIIERRGHGKAVDWWSLGTLTYDMLVGHSPFVSENRDSTMQRIRRGRYFLPRILSNLAKDFIRALLHRKVSERLGYGHEDVASVKHHKFFTGIAWDKVYAKKLEPPFHPHLRSDHDCSLFDPKFTLEHPVETPEDDRVIPVDINGKSYSQVFEGFSFVAPKVRAEVLMRPSEKASFFSPTSDSTGVCGCRHDLQMEVSTCQFSSNSSRNAVNICCHQSSTSNFVDPNDFHDFPTHFDEDSNETAVQVCCQSPFNNPGRPQILLPKEHAEGCKPPIFMPVTTSTCGRLLQDFTVPSSKQVGGHFNRNSCVNYFNGSSDFHHM